MLNENVLKVLESSTWDLATCADGEPNVVPVAFKFVTDNGKLAVSDVFLETTLNNIKANNRRIAISVYDGKIVDTFKEMVEKTFNSAVTAKGALIITSEKVIVTTPGADNKKFSCEFKTLHSFFIP